MGNVKAKPNVQLSAKAAKSLIVAYEKYLNDFYDTLKSVRESAEDLMENYLYIETYYPSGINFSGLPIKNPVSSKKKEFFNSIGGAVWTESDIETIRKAMLKILDDFEAPLDKILDK